MNNAIETVNRKLTELVDGQDVLPWSKPWNNIFKPTNALTGSEYTRGNLLFLVLWQMHKGYSTGLWMTFNQVNDWNKKNAGTMHVRKGEHGSPVIVPIIREDEQGETELIGATYRTVFNLDQIENAPLEKFITVQQQFEPIASIDSIFDRMPHAPVYRVGGAAYYTPKTDVITLPEADLFRSVNAYYLTKAHETIHATGHKERLARLSEDWMDGQAYSFEELVAELGAVYLCTRAGLEMQQADFDNSAAYLQGWKSALKDNRDWFVRAAALAVKAVDYVLGAKEEQIAA